MDIRKKAHVITIQTGKNLFNPSNPRAYEEGLEAVCNVLGVPYEPHHRRIKTLADIWGKQA